MPNRTRTSLQDRPANPLARPLPHPSWDWLPQPAGLPVPNTATEFWARLGL